MSDDTAVKKIKPRTIKKPQKVISEAPDKVLVIDSGEDAANEFAMHPMMLMNSILYLKLKSGEELVSFVHMPGTHIKKLIAETQLDKDHMKKEIVTEILKEELKSVETLSKDIIELHFPCVIVYMPTPKGMALTLQPWISGSISMQQVFRISMNDVLTMTDPDDSIKAYFFSTIKRMMMFNSMRIRSEEGSSSELEALREAVKKEEEDQSDEQMANLLTKVNTPQKQDESANTQSLSSNNVPYVIYQNEKKTLH